MTSIRPQQAPDTSILRCMVTVIGSLLWLGFCTAAPLQSVATGTVGRVSPLRPSQSHTDYIPTTEEEVLYDLDNDCVPDNFDAPGNYDLDVAILPGVPGDTTARHHADPQVCCYPPRGQPADSLLVYVSRCRSPQAVQFRIYDLRRGLVAVLRTYHGPCPGYAYSGFLNVRGPVRRYTLEVVVDGLRFSRPVSLGRPVHP